MHAPVAPEPAEEAEPIPCSSNCPGGLTPVASVSVYEISPIPQPQAAATIKVQAISSSYSNADETVFGREACEASEKKNWPRKVI